MLTKFESKSNRVKGLTFHPTRPWVLTSLHNGSIQLWDYRMGTLLESFDDHEGPVRGVDFHAMQPLFVSGGDDYKIKVWDYKLRRCLYTLLGHLDYIRTVQFHNEYPWVVSASDDQTIRIWNWQSRKCLSVLTGHNHYVMCASFHPKDDLVVSASLDQTVRVWDTSGLRKKNVRGAPPADNSNAVVSRMNADLFGGTDAVVKYVLEGHDRGVNWASFHPSLPLIISGADDRQVKLWRMNETKAWEVDTMRGHTNNVSCVLFHPKQELIVSNSEDRSIRVWDISKRMGVQTFRREQDRFWILAAHPSQNLLAAGHDSGMLVFKLARERPPYMETRGKLYYVRDRYLRLFEFGGGKDVPVVSLRAGGAGGSGGGSGSSSLSAGPRTLLYNTLNPAESNILICSNALGGCYELVTFPNDGSRADSQETRRGMGLSAAFVARNRFAVLDKGRTLLIVNLRNEITKKIPLPQPSPDALFSAGVAGRVLLRSDDRVVLFETQSRRELAELAVSGVKYAIWDDKANHVALLSKNGVTIATRDLVQTAYVAETVRVKSGAWDENGAFLYNTLNHIKYVLPGTGNGGGGCDSGILRTVHTPLYITKAHSSALYCLDREGKTSSISIDSTEYLFKLALQRRQYGKVLHMIKHSRLCGEAIIGYLQRQGFPEVALHFVTDQRTRFRLAIACGDIDTALSSAYELEDAECWHALGVAALRQGNHQVVEMAYQQTKNFERLSFLYLITGNTEKLRKMLKIAGMRGDVMSRFHNALYLGDVGERVAVLEAARQLPLAYLTAATHGMAEEAARLAAVLEEAGLPLPPVPQPGSEGEAGGRLLLPPTPIMREDNWPLLTVSRSPFSAAALADGGNDMSALGADDEDATGGGGGGGGGWGGDDDELDFGDPNGTADATGGEVKAGGAEEGGGGWGGDDDELDFGGLDDDLDLGDDDGMGGAGAGGSSFVAPSARAGVEEGWVQGSSVAAHHVAAGSMETAMKLLNRQIGVVNFAPLRPAFQAVSAGAHAMLPCLPSLPPLRTPLLAGGTGDGAAAASAPCVAPRLSSLVEQLKLGYKAFKGGAFAAATAHFSSIVHTIPLLSVAKRSEVNEVKELLGICREYLTALRLETERKAVLAGTASAGAGGNPAVRAAELAAYFTHCNLQPAHLLLALRLAMTCAYKIKNFITAASFARRLLELPEASAPANAKLRNTARKVLQISEQNARNTVSLAYDERNPFSICCASLTPIYKGSPLLRCPYCGSAFLPEHRDAQCSTCSISQVGLETLGLVCFASRR